MKGIVFTGEKAEVTGDLDVRAPGPTEVKVKIAAAGVCHSDISVIDGTIPWPAPSVLGHEGAGVVAEVGGEVTGVKPGDHVVITTLANCGRCRYCSMGRPTWCRASLGNMDKPFTLSGEPAWNFAATSVFAEHTIVQQMQVVPIDPSVPLTSACLIGCGVLTGVGAVFNRAKVQRGDNVAVFGVGGVGLNVIQGCRIAGASRIVAVDTVTAKEAAARQFGATDFVDANQPDIAARIRELLPGAPGAFGSGGVDVSFDCVGHPAVLRNAIDILDWGGTCVILGVPPPNTEMTTIMNSLTHVDRAVMGCRYGSVRPHYDVPLMIDLYQRGQLLLDELVSATYPVEQFQTVVDDLHEGKLARGVLTF